MVEFVLGRAGSGKSTWILNRIKEQLALNIPAIYVVVPEQFTFETERKYYRELGAKAFSKIRVVSFSRIAHNVFKEFGGAAGDYADDSIKMILMNEAVHLVKEELEVYSRSADRPAFSESMLNLVSELKNADVAPAQMEQMAKSLPQSGLKSKTNDITLLYTTYAALLERQYKDSMDDLSRACEKIREQNYFLGCLVYIDEFKGFTEKEMQMIRLMMKQAEGVIFSLCCDPKQTAKNSFFQSVIATYRRLKRIAAEESTAIKAPVILSDSKRFLNPALSHLERNILSSRLQPYEKQCDGILTVLAGNEYEEADYVAAEILELVQFHGYRYRDIVVVSRNLSTYQNCLEHAFESAGIPYYLDSRQSIAHTPVVRMIEYALSCMTGGYESDQVISLLKCGLCGYSVEEIASLENYVFLWDIKGAEWKKPFVSSVFGAQRITGENQKQENDLVLLVYNQMRERVIGAMEQMKTEGMSGSAYDICQAVLHLLQTLLVREYLNEQISTLHQQTGMADELKAARSFRQSWESVGEILSIMAQTMGQKQIGWKRFSELFSLLSAHYDVGTIPQTIDSVTVGSAERIRTDCPKALFVIGVNDKVFPYVPDAGGLFTDRERSTLISMGLELSKPVYDRIQEERFIAYKTMSIPSERLYLTGRKADIKGSPVASSVLFAQIRRMFGDSAFLDTADLDGLYFCRTKQTAFSVLANRFRQDTPLTASLREYFSQFEADRERMEHIFSNLEHGAFTLKKEENIKKLFGQKVLMSPTRVEDYHKCKFLYFCQHGLQLKPRQKVRFNAANRGLTIHFVLERVCSQITDYSTYDENKIDKLVDAALEEYLLDALGGEEMGKRFLYLYRRMKKSIMLLIRRLFSELAQSSFVPSDFEYTIGERGNARPLAIRSEKGIEIYLIGTVDRIDIYEENGIRYLRVVDYKSGLKKFQLSDVVNGLNLQMFLYLLCLERNGIGKYHDAKAAGVLYMPASDPASQLGRDTGEQEIQKNVQDHYCMKGIILDEEPVIRAMETDLKGRYVPVSVKKSAYETEGRLKEDVFIDRHANESFFSSQSMEALLNAQQLGKLFRYIEHTVEKMADELYGGNIEAKPLSGNGLKVCEYCAFRHVCGHEDSDPVNEYRTGKKQDVLQIIDEEE
jgi:ATP-dependent helicase/nuclease subunit B